MALTSIEYAEVKRILKEQTEDAVINATEAIGSAVEGIAQGRPVGTWYRTAKVSRKFSTRPIGNVTIMHPAGQAMQARHGTLTKAAASLGFEVKGGADGLVDYVSKSGKKSRITQAQFDNYTRKR